MNTRPLPPRLQRDRALRLFIEKVRRLPRPPEMIVLYGSRARGDHRPDSDYDLLVVLTEKDWQTVDELYQAVQEVAGDHPRHLVANTHPRAVRSGSQSR